MKVMLAERYDHRDVAGWWMSEKLDGVRAVWDGSRLVSRNGNEFHAPGWFLAELPTGVVLDGELWMGRGAFQKTVSVVKKKAPVDAEWRGIRFMVFDAPEAVGGFEERLAFCARVLEGCEVAEVLAHKACVGKRAMNRFFDEVCADGGEGIMLREPGSAYEAKRSRKLMKLKPFESDEAVMIGTEPGAVEGMIGALVLRWGKVIFRVGVGMSDEERMSPPEKGARITFGFCGLTDGGCPRFPRFVAVREYE